MTKYINCRRSEKNRCCQSDRNFNNLSKAGAFSQELAKTTSNDLISDYNTDDNRAEILSIKGWPDRRKVIC